ncbi:MAG: WD40 repeat domain-containing protein [Caulobacteraceae bacterium]
MSGIIGCLAACVAIASCSKAQVESINFPLNVQKEMDLSTPSAVVAVAWSPDGSKIAAASDFGDLLTIWDASGKKLNKINIGNGPYLEDSLSFVDGSSQLLFPPPSGVADAVSLDSWDIATGKVVRTLEGPEPSKSYPFNRAEHFTASDLRNLVVTTPYICDWSTPSSPKTIDIYDIAGWTLRKTYPLPGSVNSLSLFDGGREIVMGTDIGSVFLLDPQTGQSPKEYKAFDTGRYGNVFVRAVAGSPDGTLVFAGAGLVVVNQGFVGSSNDLGTRRWERAIVPAVVIRVTDGRKVASFPNAVREIREAAWDPRGRYVAFIDSDRSLILWRPFGRRLSYEKLRLPSNSLSLAISPNGDRIAVATSVGLSIYALE